MCNIIVEYCLHVLSVCMRVFQTHQILLTQLPELLKLLGYQELSTSDGTPHLSEYYQHRHRVYKENNLQYICCQLFMRKYGHCKNTLDFPAYQGHGISSPEYMYYGCSWCNHLWLNHDNTIARQLTKKLMLHLDIYFTSGAFLKPFEVLSTLSECGFRRLSFLSTEHPCSWRCGDCYWLSGHWNYTFLTE